MTGVVVAGVVGFNVAAGAPRAAVAQGDTISDPSDGGGPLEIKQAARSFSAGAVTITIGTYRPFADSDANFDVWIDTAGHGLADHQLRLWFDGTKIAGWVSTNSAHEVGVAFSRPDGSSIAASVPLSLFGDSSSFDWAVRSTFVPTVAGQSAAVDNLPDQPTVAVPRGFVRVGGADRVATSVQASFFGDGEAAAVVLARADDFADALAGVPLASAKDAPLLLNPTNGLDPQVAAEIVRVLPKGRTVYLVGGTNALSDAVAQAIRAAGYVVVRLAGADRYGTALAIASQALGDPAAVLLARGDDFADALSAGPAAATSRGAILLTDGPSLTPDVAAYLQAHTNDTVTAIGGPAAAADPSATPIVGADRYTTATAVATQFFPEATGIGLASGANFPDGLSGGAAIAGVGGPIVLTLPTTLSAPTSQYLHAEHGRVSDVGATYVFGGSLSIADPVVTAADTALG